MKVMILFFLVISSAHAGKFFNRKSRVLFKDESFSFNQNWLRAARSEEESKKILLKFVLKSSTGKRIAKIAKKRAEGYGKTLLDIFSQGPSSITDTTLIRKFSRTGPLHIIYETRSQIFIDDRLSVKNAILDLAHELTHFALRTTFNPYNENFTPVNFIKSTLEGEGGEIEAFLVECAVLKDLFPSSSYWSSNCPKVGGSKNQGMVEFYKVGKHYKNFFKQLGDQNEFPYLSAESPIFISSAYGLPYPVAAFKEYKTILKKVCQNNRNQLKMIKKNYSPERLLLKQKIESRCQNIYSLLKLPIH